MLSHLSEIKNDKDKFLVMLNMSDFKPEEVQVKVADNYVVIHGKQKSVSARFFFIQHVNRREFTQQYMLPEGTEFETVKSSWSPNGILTIEALKRKKAIKTSPANERIDVAPVEDKK